jgi:hypothetical protein
MPNALLKFLDTFFLVFHSGLILFNLFGWIPRATRRWNLVTLGLTAFSWFVLGIWYGWGYCFCTDWHWSVREKLGYPIVHSSYVSFLLDETTGIVPPPQLVDGLTLGCLLASLIVSVWVNFRKR